MKISSHIFLISFIFYGFVLAQNNPEAQSSASASAGESKNSLFLVCTRLNENRWLRAFKLENGRCKTYYSKEGYVQVVSSASYFSSCEAVLGTVKKNIEEGGFKCTERDLTSMLELE